MGRRLGHEVPEVTHDLEANGVLGEGLRVLQRIPQGRVGILAIALQLQEPGHVVDARNPVGHLAELGADVPRELVRRPLNAVTEAHIADRGALVHDPREHGHGVRVVDEQRVGAELLHVRADRQHLGGAAEGPEDAPRPNRIADALAHAELGRNLDLVMIGHAVVGRAPHADGDDNIVGAI